MTDLSALARQHRIDCDFQHSGTYLAHDKETAAIEELFGTASWMLPDPIRKLGFKLISAMERRRGIAGI